MNSKVKKPASTTPETTFYSPDGEPIRVKLPDGRVAIVTDEPRTLPAAFHRAALKAGCFPTGDAKRVVAEIPTKDDPLKRREAIKDAIFDVLASAPADHAPEAEHAEFAKNYEGALNADGVPNVRFLETKLGFNIDAAERDSAFAEVRQELERGDDADDEDDDGSNIE